MNWETVIGLEVHVQLATRSKIFSSARTAFGAKPNTQVSLIDLAYPGTLPLFNKAAAKMAWQFGLAIGAEIPDRSIFARKNYFYPDLPKGYQISQYEHPIVGQGTLPIVLADGSEKHIPIVRAHLEEDAGKSLHEDFHGMTGIDLNRAGIPLLEIVSAPALSCAEEAIAYLKALHTLVRYLKISDGNMQEGSFRCDVNLSVRPKGTTQLGTRTECKNLNSFRFIERAIQYETERHIAALESGHPLQQETRLFDPVKNETRPMRSKEDAQDYRYFPDPDLLPIRVDRAYLEQLRTTLPEAPWEKKNRFQTSIGLSAYDAQLLSADIDTALYFEKVLQHTETPKLAANWILGELSAQLNEHGLPITQSPVSPEQLAHLIARITDNTLSSKTAKVVFSHLWAGEGTVDAIIDQHHLGQVSDNHALAQVVDAVLTQYPEQVAEYRAGKTKVFGFLVGQAMKATQGKANPAQLTEHLKNAL